MKKKINWQFLTNLTGQVELENFMKQFYPTASDHTNNNNCKLCLNNDNNHKMKAQYRHCLCEQHCLTRYLVHICSQNNTIRVYAVNLHNIIEKPPVQETQIHDTVKGISVRFKDIIENLIHSNISKPFNIFQKIMLEYGNEPNLPKLTQIQNYVKYRRIKNGDINSIEGLSDHIRGRTVFDDEFFNALAYDEPFYFGIDIGDGSPDSHFHLGITSKKLLQNLNMETTYHFDCTYNLVKYGFPLIVFGVSDIRRKFYPICFMITSNEQECDFTFFWNSLKVVTEKLKLDINNIEYLCTDGDRAIANSISNCLSSTKLIMCWFHLISNVIF